MEQSRTEQGILSVRCVGWTGWGAPLVKVIVDGREVGILRDKLAHDFAVPVGTHRVHVKRDFWRSLPVDVAVAAEGRSELECGFRVAGSVARLELVKLGFFLVTVVALLLIITAGLPLGWLWVVLGAEIVVFGFVWWRQFVIPGGYLFLHPVPQGASGRDQKV